MEKLFGTDGIRGITGAWPLVPDFVLRIGLAVGALLRRDSTPTTVVIGRDTRDSGPMLQSCLTSGLLARGIDVVDVGIIPTPGVAALTRHLSAAGGVVISASHNPYEQNGIKFFTQSGQKLSSDTETEIERLALAPNADSASVSDGAVDRWGQAVDSRDKVDVYLQELLSEHPTQFLSGVRIVLDGAHGAAYQVGPDVFARAGADVLALNCEPTGTNINVQSGSEHVRRNPAAMGVLIRQKDADFGIAFDGDADRVVFVDREGALVDGDHMLGVLARQLSDSNRLLAGTVVTTNMRNSGLKKYIESAGLRLEETQVGDKYVIERLIELQQEFPKPGAFGLGGEQAGHLVLLDDQHFTGDGLRTALHFARAFRESEAPLLSQFAARVGKTPQVIASATVGELPRLSKQDLATMEQGTLARYPGLIRISLRYSGTEPLFRVMLESDHQQSSDALTISDLEAIAVALCRQVQSTSETRSGHIDILNCTSGGVTVVSHEGKP